MRCWQRSTITGPLRASEGVGELCARHGLLVFRRLGADEVAPLSGSSVHRAGVYDKEAAIVQPAALARGLRRVALGVRILEQTSVRTLTRSSPVHIRTEQSARDAAFFNPRRDTEFKSTRWQNDPWGQNTCAPRGRWAGLPISTCITTSLVSTERLRRQSRLLTSLLRGGRPADPTTSASKLELSATMSFAIVAGASRFAAVTVRHVVTGITTRASSEPNGLNAVDRLVLFPLIT